VEEALPLQGVGLAIGAAGVLVILWGLVRALVRLVLAERAAFAGRDAKPQREALRQDLGYFLLLGLEFLVAADIVDTILRPSLTELAVLGAIVAIRTVIGFSLNRELALSGNAQAKEASRNLDLLPASKS